MEKGYSFESCFSRGHQHGKISPLMLKLLMDELMFILL